MTRAFFYINLCISFLGICHIILHFIIIYFIGMPDPGVFQAMKHSQMHLFGFTRSLAQFMEGFSLTMGVLMVFYGGINMILYKKAIEVFAKVPFLFIWNGVLSLLVAILCLIYFHWPPLIVFSLSVIINGFLYINKLKVNENKE